jgi:hypothetical protein
MSRGQDRRLLQRPERISYGCAPGERKRGQPKYEDRSPPRHRFPPANIYSFIIRAPSAEPQSASAENRELSLRSGAGGEGRAQCRKAVIGATDDARNERRLELNHHVPVRPALASAIKTPFLPA